MFAKPASSFLFFSAAAEIAASPFLFFKAKTSAADKSHTDATFLVVFLLYFFFPKKIPIFFITLFKNHGAGHLKQNHIAGQTQGM